MEATHFERVEISENLFKQKIYILKICLFNNYGYKNVQII